MHKMQFVVAMVMTSMAGIWELSYHVQLVVGVVAFGVEMEVVDLVVVIVVEIGGLSRVEMVSEC